MPHKKSLNPRNVIREFDRRALTRKGLSKVLSDRFALKINDEFDHHCNVLIRKQFPLTTKLNAVLDGGIGMGRLAKYFVKISKKIVGVDFSTEIINVAKEYLRGNKKVTLIKSDLTKYNLKQGHFDLGILSLVLKHNNDAQVKQIVTNMKKLCKSILFIDHVAGGSKGSKIAIIRDEKEYINAFKPMKPVFIEKFKRLNDNILFCIFK